MKKMFIIFALSGLLGIGCAAQKPMYYWGNYSNTLYQYKKAPSDSTLQKHKEEIAVIIQKSKEIDVNVPPGIYGEYGFILLKTGDKAEAIKYFDLEEHTYPESRVFIEKIKSYLVKN